MLGIKHLFRAIHLLADKLIHKAKLAQTKVFNIIGMMIVSPGVPGMI